jgi:hypothetical protein
MGGKSGGGGGGAGAMLKYGDKALDLQKQIYEENKVKTEPYYRAGTSGLNELMMRMGLPFGSQYGNNASEIRNALLPKYTTQIPATAGTQGIGGLLYNINTGEVVNPNNPTPMLEGGSGYDSGIWKPVGGATTGTAGTAAGTKIDEAGLNAAVQAEIDAMNAAKNNPLYGSLLHRFSMQDFEADPSYAFRLSEGSKALERALAARGKFGEYNPEAAKALTRYGQDMASQEYQNAYNRYNSDQGNIYNRLANITGIGQTATGQLTGLGQNYANAGTELYTGMGNAVTASQQAQAANRQSMFNSILGAGLSFGLAPMTGGGSLIGSLFSDKNLKENIKSIGKENGHNVYEFNYIGSNKRYIGVLAQEVQKSNPEAIQKMDGYLAVDYDQIGVKFREA